MRRVIVAASVMNLLVMVETRCYVVVFTASSRGWSATAEIHSRQFVSFVSSNKKKKHKTKQRKRIENSIIGSVQIV